RDTSDEVVNVAETPGLRSIAKDTQRFSLERLNDEGRYHTAVIGPHTWPERIKDAYDPGIDSMIAMVGHREGFCKTLGLVVHATGAERVDVAPIGFRLRIHL